LLGKGCLFAALAPLATTLQQKKEGKREKGKRKKAKGQIEMQIVGRQKAMKMLPFSSPQTRLSLCPPSTRPASRLQMQLGPLGLAEIQLS